MIMTSCGKSASAPPEGSKNTNATRWSPRYCHTMHRAGSFNEHESISELESLCSAVISIPGTSGRKSQTDELRYAQVPQANYFDDKKREMSQEGGGLSDATVRKRTKHDKNEDIPFQKKVEIIDLNKIEDRLLEKLSQWSLMRYVSNIHKDYESNKLVVLTSHEPDIKMKLQDEHDSILKYCIFPLAFSGDKYLGTTDIEISTRIVNHPTREDALKAAGGCISFFAKNDDEDLFVITCLHIFFEEKFLYDEYQVKGKLLKINSECQMDFFREHFNVWAFTEAHGTTRISDTIYGLFGPYPAETRAQKSHVFLDVAALPVLPSALPLCHQILRERPNCTLSNRDIQEPLSINVAGTKVQKSGPTTNTTYGLLRNFNDTVMSGGIACSALTIQGDDEGFAAPGDSGASVVDDLRDPADSKNVLCHGILRASFIYTVAHGDQETKRFSAVDCAEALLALEKEFELKLKIFSEGA